MGKKLRGFYLAIAVIIGFALMLSGCSGPRLRDEAVNKEPIPANAARPLLDLEVPAGVETASFALG